MMPLPGGRAVALYGVSYSTPPSTTPIQACTSGLVPPELRGKMVMIIGDRYQTSTLRLGMGRVDLVTLTCAYTAIGKMHLLRHTSTTGNASPDQRTAMLKMLTADYCGTGRSFTHDGQPLRFQDRVGLIPVDANVGYPNALEAIWSAAGAVCLNLPREGRQRRTSIDDECTFHGHPVIRECTRGEYLQWRLVGDLVSVHPGIREPPLPMPDRPLPQPRP